MTATKTRRSTVRIYRVEINEETKLIRAATKSQAVRHAVNGSVKISVASQDDLVELVAEGIKVEDAGRDEE